MIRKAVFTMAALAFVAATASAQDAKLVAKGEQLFAANKCTMCHSVAGKGNAKGPLDGVGSKYTADEIRDWLLKPADMATKHKATRKPMKQPYTKLAKEDLDALVAYVQSLKKK